MDVVLPASIRVIVRGWLNSNQIVLRARGENVVVDSGYCTHRERTLELVARALDGEPLERLVNTHCHCDHIGGNAAIAAAYGCRVSIPEGEVKNVEPWTRESASMAYFDQRADPFRFDDTIAAADGFEAGGFEWRAHAAPGHDMDALVFFEPRNRILISGDALWRDGMGLVWPAAGANPFIDAARETLAMIEALRPSIVIPGHGEPFAAVDAAIATVRSKLDALAADPARNARHVAKVLFVFALLDRGSMRAADVPAYVASVPCYPDLSARFLGLDSTSLAEMLLADLSRSGALSVRDGVVRPAMAA